MKRILTTLVGPSGSGKSVILEEMCKSLGFERLIGMTTRTPRPGEVDGKDYYFVTPDTFIRELDSGRMLQHVHFNGQFYGTPAGELDRVLELGKRPIVIVEPSGVEQFENIGDDIGFRVFSVFIWAYLEVLIQRYLDRMCGETVTGTSATYHAKRLSSLVKESEDWCTEIVYDVQIENSKNNPDRIEAIARDIKELVEEVERQGK